MDLKKGRPKFVVNGGVRRSTRINKGIPPSRFSFDDLLTRKQLERSKKELEVLSLEETLLQQRRDAMPHTSTPQAPKKVKKPRVDDLDGILGRFKALKASDDDLNDVKEPPKAFQPEREAPVDPMAVVMEKFLARQAYGNDVQTFDGKIEEWPMFLSWYNNTISICQYTEEEKLLLLQRSLRGDAREAVQFMLYSSSNVGLILNHLKERFGRPEYLIKTMVGKIRDLPHVRMERPETLIKFLATLTNLVIAIKDFNSNCYIDNPYLMEEVLAKLPMGTQIQWSEYREVREYVNLRTLADWLAMKARAAGNRLQLTEHKPPPTGKPPKKTEKSQTVATTMTNEGESCTICDGRHGPSKCEIFLKAPVNDRWKMVSNKMLCFSCLKPKHSISKCKKNVRCSVDGCLRKHNTLLHTDDAKHKAPRQGGASNGNLQHGGAPTEDSTQGGALAPLNTVAHTQKVADTLLMKIVPVVVSGPKGSIKSYAFLDEGSSVTMMKSSLADKIGASGPIKPLRWQGATPGIVKVEDSQCITCDIQGTFNGARKYTMKNVRTVNNMGLPRQTVDVRKLNQNWRFLEEGSPESMTDAEPEMLIGMDNAGLIICREVIHGQQDSPYLVKTLLGWAVIGRITQDDLDSERVFTILERQDELFEMVKGTLGIEAFGTEPTGQSLSRDDKKALEIMEATTKRTDDGRFETGLLWKGQQPPEMPESKHQALRRLHLIEQKLDKDPQLAAAYCAKMEDHIEKKYLVKVTDEEKLLPPEKVWYLPHFAIYNPAKGKYRIVFDCAAKSHGKSFNDALMKGPDLLKPLPMVMGNFRRGRFAFTGDIREMFHRVYLRKIEMIYQQVFWRGMSRDKPPELYKLQVLTFGASCSPTLAAYVKNLNAKEFEKDFPDAVKGIVEYTYCDDYLGTADSIEEARQLINDIIHVNKAAGFDVVNWTANDPRILDTLQDDMKSLSDKDGPERVLGLWWNSTDDVFTFKANFHRVPEEIFSAERVPTMREILRLVMSVFDPLGFLAHFTVKGKIILQNLWRLKAKWDEEVPDDVLPDWREFLQELQMISQVSIPRCFSLNLPIALTIQLHIFGDASSAAYATVAYLRIVSVHGTEVSFVSARSSVAPIKYTTIPRLELRAAVLNVRLTTAILDSLHVNVHDVIHWSDSQTVLKWIRSDSKRYKVFVANRISEIEAKSDIRNWRWVPTKENPADAATRMVKSDFSETSQWYKGPKFLQLEESLWPKEGVHADNDESDVELACVINCDTKVDRVLPDMERFSRWNRLVRATAQVRNFAQFWLAKVRSRKVKNGEFCRGPPRLQAKNLIEAEQDLFREIQNSAYSKEIQCLKEGKSLPKDSDLYTLMPFLDKDGLLKTQNRLTNSEFQKNYPIVLPQKHWGTKLIIMDIHVRNRHQGREQVVNSVRERFHVPRVRVAVRRAWNECQKCKNDRAKPQIPEMAPLPPERVNDCVFPFVKCGMDFFGPLEVKVGRRIEKRWGVIFTCMATRAVHLEIVHSMTTNSAIMAIRRMENIWGPITDIFCDNGTNLRGADNEFRRLFESLDKDAIQDYLSEKRVQFHFSPPATPHMGGVWERLIRSVKTVLKEVMKSQHPSDEELRTYFTEVQCILNNRPLTYVATEPEDDTALTPNLILLRRSGDNRPIGEFDDGDLISRKTWRKVQRMADQFWQRWMREYLPELARRTKWYHPVKPIAVGDVVVICDGQLPRNKWPMGRVVEVFVGKDGKIRSAAVQTKEGVYDRPVVKLAALDVSSAASSDSN
ncbi:uncharacterized protein LOC129791254 [Lutzomyia longipalpis]|uniref:uncharacterized protein LOC129791254 n=1 Tax=Lutzomyia longipalpis TaxID=7200 RepID=UPI0024836189|nr:uncharacterized protein LOC129791254 [Lutzomyia longipalpis]